MYRPLGISINRRNRSMIGEYARAGIETTEISIPAEGTLPAGDIQPLADFAVGCAEEILRAGMRLRSVHLPFGVYWNPASPDPYARANCVKGQTDLIRLAARLGARYVVLHVSCGKVPDGDRPLWAGFCRESLEQLHAVAEEANVRIAAENLPAGSLVNGSEALSSVTADFALADVCFDVNHLFLETHSQFLQRVKGHVIATHLSDYDGERERHWMPGMGVVPWRQVMEGLVRQGYDGAFTFELGKTNDGGEYSPEAVTKAFDWLTRE